jgi:hypothetical protein
MVPVDGGRSDRRVFHRPCEEVLLVEAEIASSSRKRAPSRKDIYFPLLTNAGVRRIITLQHKVL